MALQLRPLQLAAALGRDGHRLYNLAFQVCQQHPSRRPRHAATHQRLSQADSNEHGAATLALQTGPSKQPPGIRESKGVTRQRLYVGSVRSGEDAAVKVVQLVSLSEVDERCEGGDLAQSNGTSGGGGGAAVQNLLYIQPTAMNSDNSSDGRCFCSNHRGGLQPKHRECWSAVSRSARGSCCIRRRHTKPPYLVLQLQTRVKRRVDEEQVHTAVLHSCVHVVEVEGDELKAPPAKPPASRRSQIPGRGPGNQRLSVSRLHTAGSQRRDSHCFGADGRFLYRRARVLAKQCMSSGR